MKRTVSFLLSIYLFFGMFVNAFALSSFVTISTFIAFVLVLFYFILLCFSQVKIQRRDNYFLALFWVVLTFSSILFSRGSKCFNHYIMWSFSFFVFYYVFKALVLYLLDFKTKLLPTIFNTLSLSVFLASIFAIIEFVLINSFGITLENIVPRGTVEEYTPLAFNYIRARSFMEESGQFALFLEIFAPITTVWIFINVKYKIIRYLYISVVIISLFLSFSAFGLVAFAIALLIYLGYLISSAKNMNSFLVKLFLICVVFALIIIIFSYFLEMAYQIIVTKLDSDNASLSDRTSRVDGLEYFLTGINLIIGYGAAAFSTLNIPSFISLYIGILMSTGILGVGLFFCFLLKSFKSMLKIRDKRMRWAFVTAFVISSIHFCFVDLIYVSWYWTMLALACVLSMKENLLSND